MLTSRMSAASLAVLTLAAVIALGACSSVTSEQPQDSSAVSESAVAQMQDVVGMDFDEAREMLEAMPGWIQFVVSDVRSQVEPPGAITTQYPEIGTPLPPGTTIRLDVVETARTAENVSSEMAEDVLDTAWEQIPAGPNVFYALTDLPESHGTELIFLFEGAGSQSARTWEVLKEVVDRKQPDLRAAGIAGVGFVPAGRGSDIVFLVDLSQWRLVRTSVDQAEWLNLIAIERPLKFREAG